MAAVTKKPGPVAGVMHIGLNDPGMTRLHRVGLAGLWMTLRAVETLHPALRDELRALGGEWDLEKKHVELKWSGDPGPFFERLIGASFGLTADGRFHFPALGHPDGHRDLGVTMQEALLNTFLQHGRTRKADASATPGGNVSLEIDGETRVATFRRVTKYAHQDACLAAKVGAFRVDAPMRVAGWQIPGGAVRHVAYGETQLTEPPPQALALLFAPVGALYFRIRRRATGLRPHFCIVLPAIADLDLYGRARAYLLQESALGLTVSGVADAALRVLARVSAEGLLDAVSANSVEVVSFGVAPWSTQQKSRLEVFEAARAAPSSLHFYTRAALLMPPLLRDPPDKGTGAAGVGTAFASPFLTFEVSPLLDHIARNLIVGRPWWRDFTSIVTDRGTWAQLKNYRFLARKRLGKNMKGVAAMVNESGAFSDPGAETIVRACHEAWRRRLGALGQRARERGESFGGLVDREFEHLRVDFVHCRTAASLRGVLTDFWSRAGGPLPDLQRNWAQVLPYLREERWQEARDLALLALASYSGDDHPDKQAENGASAGNATSEE